MPGLLQLHIGADEFGLRVGRDSQSMVFGTGTENGRELHRDNAGAAVLFLGDGTTPHEMKMAQVSSALIPSVPQWSQRSGIGNGVQAAEETILKGNDAFG